MKIEDYLGLIARRNTISQERQFLSKAQYNFEKEALKCQNEERALAAEQSKLNTEIFNAGFQLEFIEEWHWENTTTGERMEA
jgi:hypothetical protein